MKLRDRFLSWHKPLYSVPTLRGSIPLILTTYAGYISFTRGSISHQWLVVLMSIFTVMHLTESSASLRELELEPDPDVTVFAGLRSKIRLLKRKGSFESSLEIDTVFSKPGMHSPPEKRVVSMPASGLFRYWRVFRFSQKIAVLPSPVDHGIPLDIRDDFQPEDPDELIPIRDPRLLPYRDSKIHRKTGKSVMRARARSERAKRIRIDWNAMIHLEPTHRFEQISFWFRQFEDIHAIRQSAVEVSTPFFSAQLQNQEDWKRFKNAIAEASAIEWTVRHA